MSSKIEIRSLRESDLVACHALTQAERWPHRIEDWQFHYQVGDGWVAIKDGQLVGVTMWWRYGEALATIGLVLVEHAMQGQGIGGRLMSATIDSANTATRLLMSTMAGLKLYQNSGFKEVGRIGQVQGTLEIKGAKTTTSDVNLRPITHSDLEAIAAVDQDACGGDRRHVLEKLLAEGQGVAAECGGVITGFAFIRSSGHGRTVGPVVARDEETAIALSAEILDGESGFVRFDVDLSAATFVTWLSGVGLACIDEVIIMTHGSDRPASSEHKTFGLVSQAIG